MLCPSCHKDNIEGVDTCEHCGGSLTDLDVSESVLEETISSETVLLLQPKTPITIPADAQVWDALNLLVENQIGCLLVEEDGVLVGIFTERDLLNKVDDQSADLDRKVSELMTKSPETISRKDSIAYALQTMKLGGYRHLPLVNDHNQPIGIISIRDIFRYLINNFTELAEA